jgi:hypothetical protein
MKTKHTPTPWHISTIEENEVTSKNGVVCTCHGIDDKEEVANAYHIVKCVNMHNSLIAALKDAQKKLEESHQWDASDKIENILQKESES